MIRPFSEIDFAQLLLIEQLTQQSPWPEEIFWQCFKLGYLCWVFEQQDQVVGFIIATLQMGESHILNLSVHPDYQHQGIGQQLITHALITVKSKGAGFAYLEVRRSNQHAIALYQKVGFVEIAERKNYYMTKKGKEDAILYAKDLRIDDEL